jgi:dihydroceramidase
MQLLDELSMVYTTCIMMYAGFSFSRSGAFRVGLATALASLCAFITLYYHYLQDPAFHQNCFTLLTLGILARNAYLMETTLRPSLSKRIEKLESRHGRPMTAQEKSKAKSEDERDERILKLTWVMVVTGVTVFLSGFVVWWIDNEYCSALRAWRREIGLPWGILLEGHAWWYASECRSDRLALKSL